MAATIYPQGDYCVVPLAIDPALYELQPFVEEPVVGMIGSLHWEPSRSAAERLITRIWPEVKRRIPAARLLIAGWNAERYLAKYLSIPDVKVIQNLTHPVDFFSRTSVMVYAPSQGSGMKVKVMESMAYGVPVVTTWEGVEGLDYENGRDCWVEETDQAIAARVCSLLYNPAQRSQIRRAARELVEKRYSPQIVVDQLMSLYEDLLSDRHGDDDALPEGMLA
jgi:glycosyltransferase involved in cell wall biosynthesis